jgi:hypothetical protein
MREKVIATVNAPHPAAWSSQKELRERRGASRVRGCEVVSGGLTGMGPEVRRGEAPTAERTAARMEAQPGTGARHAMLPGSENPRAAERSVRRGGDSLDAVEIAPKRKEAVQT